MKKKHYKKIKSLVIPTLFGLAITPIIASSIVSNSTHTSSLSIENQVSQTQINSRQVAKASTRVDVYNYQSFANDTTPAGMNKFNDIKRIYSRLPSEITTTQIQSIVNIKNTNPNETISYTNLSRHPIGSQLGADAPIDAFATKGEISNNIMTPNYLNSKGVLAFKIDFTNSTVITSEYFFVTGFASSIISTTLPGSVYKDNVSDVPDSELPSFITFATNSVLPTQKTLIQNSRVNDSKTGTLSFALNLSYGLPPLAGFKDPSTSGGLIGSDKTFEIATSFNVDLSYKGFQPSSTLSTTSLIYLSLIIVGGVLGIVLFASFVTIVTRRVIARKS